MKTTALMIELLVGGALICVALVVLAGAVFPHEMGSALQAVNNKDTALAHGFLPIVLLGSIAYAAGLLSELLGRVSFEWMLNRVKRKRFPVYVSDNISSLKKSPILRHCATLDSGKTRANAQKCYGNMRSYIAMKNSRLYQQIEAQVAKLRLIRVLFIVEGLLISAAVTKVFRGCSPILLSSLVLLLITAVLNVFAVQKRFERYCREIERGYRVLVLDQESRTDSAVNRG
jgi:hypothetical protein